mmetsp:Transcript_749/g.1798  ORF Transcript_749/g.1798 Transcript_749/m.1798 type:complete len:102 (-) Transcript_749:1334-1639(-)
MNLKETCSYLGATAYRLLKLIASNGVHCRTTSAWLVSDRSVDQKDCFNPYHEYRGDGLPAMASDRVCANIDCQFIQSVAGRDQGPKKLLTTHRWNEYYCLS